MKPSVTLLFFLLTFTLFAQEDCEYAVNSTDSTGTYKSTKETMISEKKFGETASYIFFSLAQTNGLPTLNIQMIRKSKDFIRANCFDKNSKLFLQLSNGKIATLIQINQEDCGTLIRDEKGFDNRVNTGTFVFTKDNYEDLKRFPISMIRIKYLTDTEDYILKKEFTSELDNKVYRPDTFFINTLKCIE